MADDIVLSRASGASVKCRSALVVWICVSACLALVSTTAFTSRASAADSSAAASLITYIDSGPSFATQATTQISSWAKAIRSEDGAVEAIPLAEIGRPERFAVITTWTDVAKLNAHKASGAQLDAQTIHDLSAPPDERIGELYSIAPAQPAESGALYVLIHIDVVPEFANILFPARPSKYGKLLDAHVQFARTMPGALRYEVWRQSGTPNHFAVIEVWANKEAYARYVEDQKTRDFRAKTLGIKGALYDERLYHQLD